LTGDDYRESLLLQAKLEKQLGANSRMIPKRQRVYRIADEILKHLNVLDDASEKDPNSTAARDLDQLHYQFGTDNVVDLAMVLANMQLKKEEKDRFKKLTSHGGIIDLAEVGRSTRSTLTGEEEGTTADHVEQESQSGMTGGQEAEQTESEIAELAPIDSSYDNDYISDVIKQAKQRRQQKLKQTFERIRDDGPTYDATFNRHLSGVRHKIRASAIDRYNAMDMFNVEMKQNRKLDRRYEY